MTLIRTALEFNYSATDHNISFGLLDIDMNGYRLNDLSGCSLNRKSKSLKDKLNLQ